MSLTAKSPHDILSHIGDRARTARLARGWAQAELAARAAVPLPTYRVFERTGRISTTALVRIASALGRLSEIDRLFEVRPESLDEVVASREPRRRRGRTVK